MKIEKDILRLGLKYEGKEQELGEPVYFLSNGQANVFALSIFFSFARKQNWSKLDSILLDDTAEHLDNLDALPLIDSIRNFAIENLIKQIILSTYDFNLYMLMILKFRILSSRDI